MEYLIPAFSFDIFPGNYFTSFRPLIHHGVNNIQATDILNKNRLKEKNLATLSSAHRDEKQRNFDSGWLERKHCGLHSFF